MNEKNNEVDYSYETIEFDTEGWFLPEPELNWLNEDNKVGLTSNVQKDISIQGGNLTLHSQDLDIQVNKIYLWGMEIDEKKGRFYIQRVIPFAFTTAFIFWWSIAFFTLWFAYKGFNIDAALSNVIKVLLSL